MNKLVVEVELPETVTEDDLRGIIDFIHGKVISITRDAEHRNGAVQPQQNGADCEHELDNDEQGLFCIKCGERVDAPF